MRHPVDDDLSIMSDQELLTYACDHAALADRARHHIKQRRLRERQQLADWMKEHRGMFLAFFHIAGCKRPEEAFESITEHPEQYRPMAYAQKDEL
jgi:hypothetical protein